jgi:hypothetical protein
MRRNGLVSQLLQQVLGFWAAEQFCPTQFRLQFGQEESGEPVLFFLRKFGCFRKGLFKKFCHVLFLSSTVCAPLTACED